ncbi:MAG: PorP/SprF family type IX secretion system membrane protein [Bacteroidales bacterium]|nr:PorP/SprF family type IX secretion system membrane protein [Bacteroidales bacterium]
MKNHIVFIILVLVGTIAKGQDYHFSQYMEAPMMVSPALSGYFDGNYRFNLIYKSQWHAIQKGYRTFAFAADGQFLTLGSGFLAGGINVLNDVAGTVTLKNLVVNLNVAYHVKLNETQFLGAGIYGGVGQRGLDLSNAQWGSQYDGVSGFNPSLPSNENISSESFLYADFGFGLNYGLNVNSTTMSSNDGLKLITGFALYHVTQPKFKYYATESEKLNMRITAYVQSLIGIANTNLAVKPSIIYNQQGKQNEILPGVLLRYQQKESSKYTGFVKESYFSLGALFRARDAIIPMFSIEMNDFTLGITYDINVSSLRKATSGKGGLEFNLKYVIKNRNVNRSLF